MSGALQEQKAVRVFQGRSPRRCCGRPTELSLTQLSLSSVTAMFSFRMCSE